MGHGGVLCDSPSKHWACMLCCNNPGCLHGAPELLLKLHNNTTRPGLMNTNQKQIQFPPRFRAHFILLRRRHANN